MIPPSQNLNFDQPPAKSEDVDWEAAWQSLYRHRWLILTLTGVAFCSSTLLTALLPNLYTAQASILVERVNETPLHFKEILFPIGEQGAGYYETKVALLKSRPILGQTINRLNLIEHYHKRDHRVKDMQDAVKVLQKNVHANVLGRTQIIKVAVKDTDPKMAADIANTLSENFVREAWRERFFISDQLLKWFPDEAGTLQKNSPIQQLRTLHTDELVTSLPSVMQDPVLNGIKQDRMKVDAEIREFSRRYTEEHPKMKELRARANYLESEIKAQIEKIIGGLKAGLAGQFGVNNIKIVENATAPTTPSSPKRLRIILSCTVLILALSAWLAIFLEYLNHHVRTEEDVKRLGLSFLGYLPRVTGLETASNGKSLSEVVDSEARLADDVMNIRTALLFSMPAERGKLIMCTSSVPGEGKTTIAGLLGISLAESGFRVLLVDADMRNSSLHKMFKLENQEGLSACLAGTLQVKDAIQVLDQYPSLHVLPAGKRPPNPAVLLGSLTMGKLIEEVAGEYDKIIFDVPPILHIADAFILAERMHGAVLVFEAGKVHQTIGKKLIEKVSAVHGILIGAIINRADFQNLDYQVYQHYHQYQKYYHSTVGNAN
ncbi:MAG: polysaccharide biosynthesis tyrosine autokinase [Candidatus Omnitrophica bacterium]|nr:polysaccharide biosynthesis tyrosine autokinase [Candidatus Omnitrophota bacterium]